MLQNYSRKLANNISISKVYKFFYYKNHLFKNYYNNGVLALFVEFQVRTIGFDGEEFFQFFYNYFKRFAASILEP